MARIVKPDEKRKKLTQDALRQFRHTRSLIAPEVLDAARRVIEEKTQQADRKATPNHVAIDRRQNMTVIMKFLELKAGDKNLQRQIADLFPEA